MGHVLLFLSTRHTFWPSTRYELQRDTPLAQQGGTGCVRSFATSLFHRVFTHSHIYLSVCSPRRDRRVCSPGVSVLRWAAWRARTCLTVPSPPGRKSSVPRAERASLFLVDGCFGLGRSWRKWDEVGGCRGVLLEQALPPSSAGTLRPVPRKICWMGLCRRWRASPLCQ